MEAPRIVTTIGGAVLAAVALAAPAGAGPIVGEWEPGLTEAEVGGPIVVDGYGVNGLGLYQVVLDDGAPHAAVCVEADVGHSLSAEYRVEPGVSFGGELDYLAWAYLSASPPSDVQAAAINVLAWRYSDARRSTGGPVWDGDDVDVRALGVGPLTAVEQAVTVLHDEATARRGPWSFTELVVADGSVGVGVIGPAGPIAGVAVTFTATNGWSAVVSTGADGRATAAGPVDETIEASALGPGAVVALVALGSQRLVVAGPPSELRATWVVPATTTTTTPPPPPSTTTTTTTTTAPVTTTTTPATTPTSTTSTTTETTTTSMPTSTPTSTPTTTPTPTLPVTGSGDRAVGRAGAVLFAVGALAVLVAAPGRRRRAA